MTEAGEKRRANSRWLQALHLARAPLRPVALAVFFSLLGALLEGASAALLLPTLEGALRRDFSFLHDVELAASLLGWLPANIGDSDPALFGLLVVSIFVVVVLRLAAQYVAAYLTSHTVWQLIHNLRVAGLERFFALGKGFFDAHNAGHLENLLLNHPARLGAALQVGQAALYWGAALFAYVGLMFWISWQLCLVVVVLFPLLYLSLAGIISRIRRTSVQQTSASRSLHEHAFNLLACLPLVQVAGQRDAELERYTERSRELSALQVSQARRQQLIYPVQEVLVISVVLILVALVAVLAGSDEGTVSGFLVFFYLLRRSATTFNDLNRVRGTLSATSGTVDELLEVYTDEGKPLVPSGKRVFEGLREEIRIMNLNFTYTPESVVLRDLSCRFERGKTTAIVGRTGSGKTTLVNLLMRFYDVPAGTLAIDGVDIRELDTDSLHRHMALVSQDPLLLNDSIRTNITYGIEGVSAEALDEVVSKARLTELIERQPQGYEAIVGDRGIRVSGGEKQRIALARAMLKGGEILILDEATSSLDSRTERLVQEAIDTCLEGRTAIVIAHRLSTIKNADWILLLEDGELREEGTLDDLLAAQGRFRAYWEAQATRPYSDSEGVSPGVGA